MSVPTLKGEPVKRALILCLILVCAVPLAAWSQDAAPASSHRKATLELLEVMGLEKNAMAGASAMLNVMLDQNEELQPYRDVFMKWAETTLSWDKIGPCMTELYMKTFTEAEIRELIAFYRTPTGKKTLETMPMLMQEGAKIGADIAQEHQGELEAAIMARQKELSAAEPEGGEDDEKPPHLD
jgi:hypothetical protein